ncbi:MAG: hypothetical protein JNJ71_17290 [Rubrivivax sp.]|nr:hypothetical protein [Rubrivivax sp.]
MRGPRQQALLQAFVNGPGRGLFVLREACGAQVMIADLDDPASRLQLRAYQQQFRRPGLALATRDPGWPDTVWVPKPVKFESLVAAGAQVRRLLGELPGDTAAQPLSPLSAGPGLKPGLMPRVSRAGVDGGGGSKTLWVALGLLAIALAASLMGWRPAPESRRAEISPGPTSGIQPATEALLNRAVQDSLRDFRAQKPAKDALSLLLLSEVRLREELASRAEAQQASWLALGGGQAMPVRGVAANRLPWAQLPVAPEGADATLRAALHQAVALATKEPATAGRR